MAQKFRGRTTITGALTAADLVDSTDMTLTIPVTIGIPATIASRGGANSDGVIVGSLTAAAVDYAFLFDSPAYTDDTTDMNDDGAGDVALLPATETTSDKFYFGCVNPFCGIKLTLSQAGVVAGTAAASITWEYYTGSAWASIETSAFTDDSASFTAGTSTYFITFAPPANWTPTAIDDETAYWVRATCSVADFTTQPLATQGWLLELKAACGTGVRIPFAGTITAAQMHATTASAANNDTIFLLVNVTSGAYDTITWTKGDIMDIDDTVSLAVAADDEIALMVLQEDGSTEFANSSMILEVTL